MSSITKKTEVTITVERKTRTSDGAGGYTTAYAETADSPFTGRFVRKSSPLLVAGAAGDASVDHVVLVFDAGSDIRVGDRCTVSSIVYEVRGLRSYSRTVQADVEAVR